MAPRKLLSGLDGAVAAELGLEAAGFCGGGEEEIAAGDALLQIGGQCGVLAGILAALICMLGGIALWWNAGFLWKGIRHQEARLATDRGSLCQLLVPPGSAVRAGADQVELKGRDELLADIGESGHGHWE